MEKNIKSIKNGLKNLFPIMKKLFEDGNPEVRDKILTLSGKMKN